MVFSSVTFLFVFLPLALLAYYSLEALARGSGKRDLFRSISNAVILVMSVTFYFWGETWLIWVMIASSYTDFACSRLIERARKRGDGARATLFLLISLGVNLSFLVYFKYIGFLSESLRGLLAPLGIHVSVWEVALPLGISFYTFETMSYTIDVYRGEVEATRSPIDYACYMTFFPHLIAGPIIRYRDLQRQLVERDPSIAQFASGVRRFLWGLSKKVLIANSAARLADVAFGMEATQLDVLSANLAVIAYTVQIYFDFSGYSDMAIGLGRMFGFELVENFDYPYASRSVREFWRRWHISLSSWFRDYLYIPLGGGKGSSLRVSRNLFVVFFLCGLWHGASWSFVLWGLYHGFFLSMERVLGIDEKKIPPIGGSLYTMSVVIVGWILFRADDPAQAWEILRICLGFGGADALPFPVARELTLDVCFALLWGAVFSLPLYPRLVRYCPPLVELIGLAVLFVLSVSFIVAGTHNPFIYFRF